MAAMTNRLITIQMDMAPRLAVHNILIRFQGSDLVIPTTSFSDSVMRAVPVTVSGCARHPGATQFLIQKTILPQNIAIGFTGEPVPFGIGNGATVSMNSQRLRVAAASRSASRSARSSMWTPRISRTKL